MNAHDLHDQSVRHSHGHAWPMPFAFKLFDNYEKRTTVVQSVVSTCYMSAAVRAGTVCNPSGSAAHASFSAYAPWCLVVSMGVAGSRTLRSGLKGSPVQSLLRFCPRLPRYSAQILLIPEFCLGGQRLT